MPLTVTVNLADVDVQKYTKFFLESELYDDFMPETRDAAKVPYKNELVKTVMADKAFMAQLSKNMARLFAEDADDVFEDALAECKLPKIVAAYRSACVKMQPKIEAQMEAAKREKEDSEAVTRMIKLLKAQGYKITRLDK